MLCPCIHRQKQNCFLVYHLELCRFWTTFWYQPSNWKIIFIPWTVVWARNTNQYIARTRSILIFQKIAISILKIRLICIPGLGKSSSHQPQPENGYKGKIWFDSLPWFEIFQVFEVINLISEFILDVNAHNLPVCFSFVNHGKNTKGLDFILIQNLFRLLRVRSKWLHYRLNIWYESIPWMTSPRAGTLEPISQTSIGSLSPPSLVLASICFGFSHVCGIHP